MNEAGELQSVAYQPASSTPFGVASGLGKRLVTRRDCAGSTDSNEGRGEVYDGRGF